MAAFFDQRHGTNQFRLVNFQITSLLILPAGEPDYRARVGFRPRRFNLLNDVKAIVTDEKRMHAERLVQFFSGWMVVGESLYVELGLSLVNPWRCQLHRRLLSH